jgi:hypothetical protein
VNLVFLKESPTQKSLVFVTAHKFTIHVDSLQVAAHLNFPPCIHLLVKLQKLGHDLIEATGVCFESLGPELIRTLLIGGVWLCEQLLKKG